MGDTHIPKISVIIPVYNCEAYISDCIKSVLSQTLSELEIICINDGSFDESRNILEYFALYDKRIKLINQSNKGLSYSRNIGIKHAKGKYIGFVDSDDKIDKYFYESLYLVAEENNADMAMGNCVVFLSPDLYNLKNSWIQRSLNLISTEIVTEVNQRKIIIETASVCNKIFLKSFLDTNKILFYEGLYWEDNPFVVMAAIKANKICLSRNVYYHYRQHSKSITNNASHDRKPFDFFLIMDKLKIFFDNEKLYLTKGYEYYYNELQVLYYFNCLLNRVHTLYRKKYFKEVQRRIKKMDVSSTNYLKKKVSWFFIVKYCNFYIFELFRYVIKAIQYVVNSLRR